MSETRKVLPFRQTQHASLDDEIDDRERANILNSIAADAIRELDFTRMISGEVSTDDA